MFALLAVSLAVIGYDLIHLAQRWIAYVLIAALLVFTVAVLDEGASAGGSSSLRAIFARVPFLAQFFAAASYQIAWSIYVSDYSRYLPRNVGVGASFWWTYLGAFIGGVWTMLVGTVAAALYPDTWSSPPRCAPRRTRCCRVSASRCCSARCSGLLTITSLNFYGASLTLLSVADSFKPGRPTLAKRVRHACPRGRGCEQHRARLDGEFRREIRRVPGGAAVPVHALDRDQPGRFLLGAQRTLLGARDLQSARHVRALELARAAGLRRGIRGDDSVLQHLRPLHRPGGGALGGADIAMLVGLPVSTLVYLWACRSLDVAADRRRADAADVGLDPDAAAKV